MQIPAAMFLYAAADTLKRQPREIAMGELKELRSAWPTLLNTYGVTPCFESGYLLGLAVARVLLAANPALVKAGIDAEALL